MRSSPRSAASTSSRRIATLIQRGYVAEVGHDPGPGQAILYGTTSRFLEQVGLDSLQELPPLAGFVPEPEVVEALERGLHLRVEDANAAAAGRRPVRRTGADLRATGTVDVTE